MNHHASQRPLWVLQLAQRARRVVKRLWRPWLMHQLRQRNLVNRKPVIAPGGPVVSLTSYGARVDTVFYTIETIGQGTVRPSRLILWLEESLRPRGLPDTLTRLCQRGLEVRYCDDWGPHKKYLPYVMATEHPDCPLVTADDDHLYPKYWLDQLAQAHRQMPDMIHCFRAHRIALTPQGELLPYQQWRACRSTVPSHRHFATGASGVLYPVGMQQALRQLGDAFITCCPRADDIWLNLVAFRLGLPVHQLTQLSRSFYEIPGTRSQGLAQGNVAGGGNDRQLALSYQKEDLKRLANLPESP